MKWLKALGELLAGLLGGLGKPKRRREDVDRDIDDELARRRRAKERAKR